MVLLLTVVLALVLTLTMHPVPAYATSSGSVIDAVNAERAARGLPALQPYADSSRVIRANDHLAATGGFHGLASEIGSWYLSNGATSFAENQAYRDSGSASATAFARMWTESASHAVHQFNPEMTHIAAAVTSSGGNVYATVQLVALPGSAPAPAAPTPDPEPAPPKPAPPKPAPKPEPKPEPEPAPKAEPTPKAEPAPDEPPAATEPEATTPPSDDGPDRPEPDVADPADLDTELALRLEGSRGSDESGTGERPLPVRSGVSAAATELAGWSADALSTLLAGPPPDDVMMGVVLDADLGARRGPTLLIVWLLAVAAMAATAVASSLHRRVRTTDRLRRRTPVR